MIERLIYVTTKIYVTHKSTEHLINVNFHFSFIIVLRVSLEAEEAVSWDRRRGFKKTYLTTTKH